METSKASPLTRFKHAAGAPVRLLDALGEQGTFYLRVFAWVYRAIFRYKKEQTRLIAEVGMGSGALALIGGLAGGFLAYAAFNGYQTSTMNFQTFSQVAFAFAVTPSLLMQGVSYALAMGFIGGLLPAIRAARLPIASALREL